MIVNQRFPWDNLQGHIDQTEASIALARRDVLLRYFRDDLELATGFHEGLAFQLELDPDIDFDATRAAGSRFENNLSESEDDPESRIRVDLNEVSCSRDYTFAECLRSRERFDVATWISVGTFAEDNPNPRSAHHFHDPVYARGFPVGNHGLDDEFENTTIDNWIADLSVLAKQRGPSRGRWLSLVTNEFPDVLDLEPKDFNLRGRSAVDRALNTLRGGDSPSDRHPENLYALPDAERYLYLGVTSAYPDERELYLTLHFLAIGHVLHLLQDMTSAGHTRNDFVLEHVLLSSIVGGYFGSRSIDEAPSVKVLDTTNGHMIAQTLQDQGLGVSLPFQFLQRAQAGGAGTFALADYSPTTRVPSAGGLEGRDVEGLFDEQPFDDPSGDGLAEFTNRHFFSGGTVRDFPGTYSLPDAASCTDDVGRPPGASTWIAELPERGLADGLQRPATGFFMSSSLVPHLARCRTVCLNPIAGLALRLAQEASGVPLCGYVNEDESVLRDYVEIAWAHAIRYGTALIENVLGPRLEVVAVDESEFKLQNLSRQPLQFSSDAVEIVYETLDPVTNGSRRVRVPVSCSGTEPHVLAPSAHFGEPGPESSFTCSLPGSVPEAPVDQRTFWVVIRGALGGRGEVGTGDEFDRKEKSFAVAARKVVGSEVFFGARTMVSGPDADSREHLDVHSLSLDPTLNLTPADPNTVAFNATEKIREALGGDDSVDFSYPSAEPDGPLVAIRSDFGTTNQTFDATTDGDKQALFVLDPTVAATDPAALQDVPLCVAGQSCLRHEARVFALSPRNSFTLQWSSDARSIVARGPGGDSYITDAPSVGTASRLFRITVSNGLVDEAPNELETCTERPSVAALSASRVAASATCTRTRSGTIAGGSSNGVTLQSGGDVLIATLTPSAVLPGALVPQSLERFDVEAKSVRNCTPCSGPSCQQQPEVFDCGETVESESEVDVAWSPDGVRLATVGEWEVGVDWTGGHDLWVIDPSGAARNVLKLLPGEGVIHSPVWSPDGEWIAVVIGKGPTDSDIYLVDPDGAVSQSPRRVTKGLEVQNGITWRSRSPLRLPSGPP